MSLIMIVLSLEPEQTMLLFQADTPTLERWPPIVLMHTFLTASQICILPEYVPTDRYCPF